MRKQTPAVFEAFFTKGATGSHVIETELGKVEVGICYENQLAYIPRIMHQESVNLLLMPHSAPTVMRTLLGDRRVKRYEDSLGKLAFQYAHLLGVPVIMTNKCGRWQSPLPGVPFHVEDSIFPGLSSIADSDGALKAQLGREEDVIVEDIVFDPSRKSNRKPKCHGRWAWKDVYGFPWLARTSCPVIEGFGHLWYAASAERRRRARDISSAHYGAANMNKWHHRVRSYFDLPQYACHLSSCSRQAEGWFEESGSVYSNARTTMFMSTCLSLQVIHNPPSLASHPGIAPRSPVYGTEGEWPMSPTTHLTPAHKML